MERTKVSVRVFFLDLGTLFLGEEHVCREATFGSRLVFLGATLAVLRLGRGALGDLGRSFFGHVDI